MPEPGSKSRLEAPLTGRFDLSSPGIVMLKTGKVELGQGILLALRQIAAEELDLAIDAVVTVSGDTSASPFEGGTVGSMSLETSGREVRDAAAELRSVLFDAAARKLGVSVSEITADEGQIFAAGSRSMETFWSLAADIRFDRPLRHYAVSKSPKLYQVVGTNIPQTHLLERLGGGAFIHDLSFDGMLHGRVLRKPHPDARLESVDADAIRGPGVRVVHEGDFIGVVAESEQALAISMGRLERRCRWSGIPDGGPQTPLDILANARVTERILRADQGSSDPNLAEDGQTLSAVYSKPLIGHGSIGPSCGIATVSDSGVEIWSQSQNVFALRDQIARVLGRPAPDVVVRHRLGAGCYGHNGADDAAMDAAMLARRARRVVSRVAEISECSKPCDAGFGWGLGFARFKNTGSYCAVVALISVDEAVKVHKLWAAVDAGLVINPAGVVSQIEGGMLQAASWVLKETVPTDGTRLVAESWKDYPILSFAETPETIVEIIAGSEFPSTGVGEVSLGPTAGAIANAVANALGLRVRDLPLTRERLMKAALEAE
jgi:CO/xanthine dehydrogenase Mo-binding subunit